MRIVLLGPPGSGKTNVSNRIGKYCDLPVITCNGVLTRAAAEDSELGRLAKEAMNTNRVSDELLLALLRVRLSQREVAEGFVLVDFPRNVGQADVVDGILDTLGRPIDLVLFISVDGDELMERLVGRIQCDHCGAKYNLYINPPLVEGICDNCGARVNRRPDDYEETISNRLRIYDGLMGPLSQYYQLHGKLRKVDGNGGSDQVWGLLKKIIDATPRTVIETEPVSEPAVLIEEAHAELEKGDATEAPPRDTLKPVKKRKAKPKTAQVIKSKPTEEQALAEKTQSKKAAAKKGVSKKVGTKKAAAEKQKSQPKKTPIAKKTPAQKKAAAKKLAAKKKVTAKKQAVEKVGAKGTIAKNSLKKSVATKAGPSSKKPVKKSVPSKKKSVSKKPSVAKKSATPAVKRKTSDKDAKSKKKAKAKKKSKK